MAVDHVVIHHEGANRPSNIPASQLYSIWLGATTFTMSHGPELDGSTAGLNGDVLGVCWSGQRHKPHWYSRAYKITDNDLDILTDAMAQARARGWVTDNPRVDFHGDPELQPLGNNTACPGNLTYKRRPEIEAACRVQLAAQEDDDVPAPTDIVDELVTKHGRWLLEYQGGVRTVDGKFYGSYLGLPKREQNDPDRRFLTITARDDDQAGYVLRSLKGEQYEFHKVQ